MSDGARIVLVKPGDVLIIGNVSIDPEDEALGKAAGALRELLGLAHVLIFEDDIDLAVTTQSLKD